MCALNWWVPPPPLQCVTTRNRAAETTKKNILKIQRLLCLTGLSSFCWWDLLSETAPTRFYLLLYSRWRSPRSPFALWMPCTALSSGTDINHVGPRGPRHASSNLLLFTSLTYHWFLTLFQSSKTTIWSPTRQHFTRQILFCTLQDASLDNQEYIVHDQQGSGYSIIIQRQCFCSMILQLPQPLSWGCVVVHAHTQVSLCGSQARTWTGSTTAQRARLVHNVLCIPVK